MVLNEVIVKRTIGLVAFLILIFCIVSATISLASSGVAAWFIIGPVLGTIVAVIFCLLLGISCVIIVGCLRFLIWFANETAWISDRRAADLTRKLARFIPD